jgi:hypothetical protein
MGALHPAGLHLAHPTAELARVLRSDNGWFVSPSIGWSGAPREKEPAGPVGAVVPPHEFDFGSRARLHQRLPRPETETGASSSPIISVVTVHSSYVPIGHIASLGSRLTSVASWQAHVSRGRVGPAQVGENDRLYGPRRHRSKGAARIMGGRNVIDTKLRVVWCFTCSFTLHG